MMKYVLSIIIAYAVYITFAAVPEAPKRAPKEDCKKTVAFSYITAGGLKDKSKPIPFDVNLLTKPSGSYDPQTGIFTSHCPGTYTISFSGSGDRLRLLLKRRPSSSTASWVTIIGTGMRGGAQTILLTLQLNEQLGIFMEDGVPDQSLNLSFSVYKVQ